MKAALVLALLSGAAPALAQPQPPAPAHTLDHGPAHPMDHGPDHAMDHGPDRPAASVDRVGTDQPPGSAKPPPIAHDRAADRYWNPRDMAAAAASAMHAPARTYAKLTFDLAEYQFRDGQDGYRWEGEAWLGDLNRFVLKSKGEGTFGAGVDRAEVQALYAKALDPWWNLQAGIRQDIRPRPSRTWATLGIEGRAPYLFEVQAAAFLSDKGQLAARIEGAYDQRLTQRLILQPRAELDLAAQDMPDQRIGAGLSSAELGLRLRYEIRREFAPYVGINWTWAAGRTADYARADGRDIAERSAVAGIRIWF